MDKHRKKHQAIVPSDESKIFPKEVTQHEAEKRVEELPSVEWGERLNSGKTIARGGKESGFVPGATPTHPK